MACFCGFNRGQSLSEDLAAIISQARRNSPGSGLAAGALGSVGERASGVAARARASAGASCRSWSASGPQRVHAASNNAQNRVSVSASVAGLLFTRIFAAG